MPTHKKLKKLANCYEKGSKKNGKYREFKYIKENKLEKKLEKDKIKTKPKEISICTLHILIFKILAYEPDIIDLILNLLNNPIKKQLYAIECVQYLRNINNGAIPTHLHITYLNYDWFETSPYVLYIIKIIYNKNETTKFYFSNDGHMLEYYEYNDYDLEKENFGILSPQKICQLYDNDIIIKLAHIRKFGILRINYIVESVIRNFNLSNHYSSTRKIKIYALKGSKVKELFKKNYDIEPDIKPLSYVVNKKGENIEQSYYEILLYGINLEKYDTTDSLHFSYSFGKFTGFNIHTTLQDLELKYHDIRDISKDF